MSARASSMSSSVPPCRQIISQWFNCSSFLSFHFFIFFDHLSLHYRNSLHRRLLDGSPRMSTLNATSPNESQVVDGPISLGASTNGDSALPSGTSSLVLRRPSANMFVSLFSRFPLLCHWNWLTFDHFLTPCRFLSCVRCWFVDLKTFACFFRSLHLSLTFQLNFSLFSGAFQEPKLGFDSDEWDGITRPDEGSGRAAQESSRRHPQRDWTRREHASEPRHNNWRVVAKFQTRSARRGDWTWVLWRLFSRRPLTSRLFQLAVD